MPSVVPSRRATAAAVAVAGLLVWGVAIGPALALSLRPDGPRNDFAAWYAAGSLMRSGQLYDAEATAALQATLGVKLNQHAMPFVRPPFYALLLWPLGLLDYRTAYALWLGGSIAAFGAAAWLWGRMCGTGVLAAAAWNAPMAYALLRGQDKAFLLLLFSLAAWLLTRGRRTTAGLVLSLCLIKWTACFALPLLILRRRMWRTGVGLAAGAAILAAISFAVAGPGWPAEYLAVLKRPSIAPHPEEMISLSGLMSGVPGVQILEGTAAVLVLCCAFVAAGAERLEEAFAATLAAGVLVSHHAFLYDCVLLFPFGLCAARRGQTPALRTAGMLLLVPLCCVLLLFPPLSRVPQAVVPGAVILFAWMVWKGRRTRPGDPAMVDGARGIGATLRSG